MTNQKSNSYKTVQAQIVTTADRKKFADEVVENLLSYLIEQLEPIEIPSLNTIEQPVYVEKIIRKTAKQYRKKYFGLNHYAKKYKLDIVLPFTALALSALLLCYELMR
jgi:hypothetical protein